MKITTPKKMSALSKLDEILKKFEKEFNREEPGCPYYHLVIAGEYPREVYEEVKKIYTEAGWKNVKCGSFSENGERPGLSGLILYR